MTTLDEHCVWPGYRRQSVLGRGSSGTVYLTEDLSDGKDCVVKIVSWQGSSAAAHDAIRAEGRVLQACKHPNIVSVKEVAEDDEMYVLVMDHCAGGDLEDMINADAAAGRYDLEKYLVLFAQTSLAVEYLHKRGIVHRDIKSANILLTSRGIVKLADFGIAKQLASDTATTVTMCGTPFSFSPELCEGKPYDQKADIWALGIVLFEMLYPGKKPFQGTNLMALVNDILHAPIETLRPAEPADCEDSESRDQIWDLVVTMLQRDPAQRPSVGQVLQHPVIRRCLKSFLATLKSSLEKHGQGKAPAAAESPSPQSTTSAANDLIATVAADDLPANTTGAAPPGVEQEAALRAARADFREEARRNKEKLMAAMQGPAAQHPAADAADMPAVPPSAPGRAAGTPHTPPAAAEPEAPCAAPPASATPDTTAVNALRAAQAEFREEARRNRERLTAAMAESEASGGSMAPPTVPAPTPPTPTVPSAPPPEPSPPAAPSAPLDAEAAGSGPTQAAALRAAQAEFREEARRNKERLADAMRSDATACKLLDANPSSESTRHEGDGLTTEGDDDEESERQKDKSKALASKDLPPVSPSALVEEGAQPPATEDAASGGGDSFTQQALTEPVGGSPCQGGSCNLSADAEAGAKEGVLSAPQESGGDTANTTASHGDEEVKEAGSAKGHSTPCSEEGSGAPLKDVTLCNDNEKLTKGTRTPERRSPLIEVARPRKPNPLVFSEPAGSDYPALTVEAPSVSPSKSTLASVPTNVIHSAQPDDQSRCDTGRDTPRMGLEEDTPVMGSLPQRCEHCRPEVAGKATCFCVECEQALCAPCSVGIHSKREFAAHFVTLLTAAPSSVDSTGSALRPAVSPTEGIPVPPAARRKQAFPDSSAGAAPLSAALRNNFVNEKPTPSGNGKEKQMCCIVM